MNDNTTERENQIDESQAVDEPIEPIFEGECQSLSGRSTLTYAVGRSREDDTLHMAITGNSGKGMWCKAWASASAIQDIVLGEGELTARAFIPLHPGRSINTGGFYLAALKDLGLIRVNEENTRLHEHTPGVTFDTALSDRIHLSGVVCAAAAPDKPGRRKPKR